MAGKVSLQGFVATHRDSGTKGKQGHFYPPVNPDSAGFKAMLPVDSSMELITLSRKLTAEVRIPEPMPNPGNCTWMAARSPSVPRPLILTEEQPCARKPWLLQLSVK